MSAAGLWGRVGPGYSVDLQLTVRSYSNKVREHLNPGARIYTDFCTERGNRQVGAFMARYIWPGTATYVDLPGLSAALIANGFNLHELVDDTASYAYTVRDWADALERERGPLAARFGEPEVRALGTCSSSVPATRGSTVWKRGTRRSATGALQRGAAVIRPQPFTCARRRNALCGSAAMRKRTSSEISRS